MKVETFLQHCISREKFTPEEEADARKFFVDRGVRYIRDWYSQPFKPELITEWFEGWKCETRTAREPRFENDNNTILIQYRKSIDRIHYYTEYSSDQDLRLPLILDEFISDCTRNGIELKWKEILTNKENQ